MGCGGSTQRAQNKTKPDQGTGQEPETPSYNPDDDMVKDVGTKPDFENLQADYEATLESDAKVVRPEEDYSHSNVDIGVKQDEQDSLDH
jgi:hypothetical protein